MPSADIHILTDRSGAGLPPEVATRLETLFEFLDCGPVARAKIQNAAQFIPLKPDDPIFYAGELHGVLWWVLAGEVGFYRGTQRLFSVAANDVLARRPLELQVPFRYNVAASAEAWVMRLPLMIFEQCQQDGEMAVSALRDSVSDLESAYLETRDAPALERLLIGPLFRGLKPAAAQRLVQRLPAEQFAANSACEIGVRPVRRPDLMLIESGVVTLTLFGPDARMRDQADNTAVGNTAVDNTAVDNTAVDNAPADKTEVDKTPLGNAEADNATADSTAADNTAAEQVLMETDLHPGDMVPAPALAGAPGYRLMLTWLTAGRLRKLDCAEFIVSHCPRLLPEVDAEKVSALLAAGSATLLSLHDARSAKAFEAGQRETISLADLPGVSRRLTPRRTTILAADSENELLFAGLYLLGRGLRVQLMVPPEVAQEETDAGGSSAPVALSDKAQSDPARVGAAPNQGAFTQREMGQGEVAQTTATQGAVRQSPDAATDTLETLMARFQADVRAQLAVEARRERDRLAQAWARAVTRVQKEADARVQARLSELERNERSALRAAEARLQAQQQELEALRKTLDAERVEVASIRRIFEEKLAAATALQAEVLAMRNRLTGQLHDLWPPARPTREDDPQRGM